MNTQRSGFTLVEIAIAIAIIAIISAVAVPKFIGAKISGNESAAIGTLRLIASAQQQVAAACAIDTDADGGGEFAFFGELAGAVPIRVYDHAAGGPALGNAVDLLDPNYVLGGFGQVVDAFGDGVVARQGYFFKMYLPGPQPVFNGSIPGLAEDPTGGAKAADCTPAGWASDHAESLWSCYAWPIEHRRSGIRAFFINQDGDLAQCDNADATYDGLVGATSIPVFDAALSTENGGGDMLDPLGLIGVGKTANDGLVWKPVGN